MSKVYIVGGGSGQYMLLMNTLGFIVTEHMAEASLVLFTGGEDVSPKLYNEPRHHRTFNSIDRDEYEIREYFSAKRLKLPCVGICRGGQFLNVMSGGKMYQDITKHCISHFINDHYFNEEEFQGLLVSSTHHQMMIPGEGATVVATAKNEGDVSVMKEWGVWKYEPSKEDYEVILYKKLGNLCFQPHPEFTEAKFAGMRKYFGKLVEELLSLKD